MQLSDRNTPLLSDYYLVESIKMHCCNESNLSLIESIIHSDRHVFINSNKSTFTELNLHFYLHAKTIELEHAVTFCEST